MREKTTMVYSAAVNDLEDMNQSFARGKMRIAYHGRNNNGSHISKAAFEASLSSIYNRPIVAHYMAESDTIGGHDMGFARNENGLYMYHVTEPVGVVPESAATWWETVEEKDGTTKEYICCDIIVWKRQQAYAHLRENRVTDESMELEVIQRHYDENGEMHIDLFEFTAFCLLERDRPCFPSAEIELFSANKCKEQFSLMLEDFRKEFSQVITASADDINNPIFSKGGDRKMNIEELMTQYGLSAEDVTFDTEGMELSEIEQRFNELREEKQNAPEAEQPIEPVIDEPASATEPEQVADPEVEQQPEPEAESEQPMAQQFSLTMEQFMTEVYNALSVEQMNDPWCGGTMCRYWYVDCDMTANLVYAYDMMDGKLYGYTFSMRGDSVEINFAAGKRMKFQYVEFEDGADDTQVFACMQDLGKACMAKFNAINAEKTELALFKQDTLKAQLNAEQQRVFAAFEDLSGNERFDTLRENCGDMTAEELEEKCFAIRGRMSTQKFSMSNPIEPIRLPIEGSKTPATDEPYGGIFAEYGIGQ